MLTGPLQVLGNRSIVVRSMLFHRLFLLSNKIDLVFLLAVQAIPWQLAFVLYACRFWEQGDSPSSNPFAPLSCPHTLARWLWVEYLSPCSEN